MKMNIVQPTPERVKLPFRLFIREADLKKFQAATMSNRTYLDASIDFGPEDLSTDGERLACFQLSRLLFQEAQLSEQRNWFEDKNVVPGKLCLDVAYPNQPEEIQAAVVALVTEAGRQLELAQSLQVQFDSWAESVEDDLISASQEVAKQNDSWVEKQADLEKRSKKIISAKSEKALLKLKDELDEFVNSFPDVDELLQPIADRASTIAGFNGVTIDWRLRTGLMGYSMDDRTSALIRSKDVGLKAHVSGEIKTDLRKSNTHVDIELDVSGHLIYPLNAKKTIKLPALVDLEKVNEFVGENKHGRTDNYSISSNIAKTLESLHRDKVVNEMNAWIAKHGSAHLKKGVDLDYSMMRLYREERARSILGNLSVEFNLWQLSVDPASLNVTNIPSKASPSEASINALSLIHKITKKASIGYARDEHHLMRAIDDEIIYVQEGGLFQSSPSLIIYRDDPSRQKIVEKLRKK